MRVDCALLCDAATEREGLLHILGGGVTRATRQAFPAPLGLTLALRILVHPTEADRAHQLVVRLQGEDGERVAEVQAGFDPSGAGGLENLAPGEHISLPLVLNLGAAVALPRPGGYSFELLIDGIHQTSVPFRAAQPPQEQQP